MIDQEKIKILPDQVAKIVQRQVSRYEDYLDTPGQNGEIKTRKEIFEKSINELLSEIEALQAPENFFYLGVQRQEEREKIDRLLNIGLDYLDYYYLKVPYCTYIKDQNPKYYLPEKYSLKTEWLEEDFDLAYNYTKKSLNPIKETLKTIGRSMDVALGDPVKFSTAETGFVDMKATSIMERKEAFESLEKFLLELMKNNFVSEIEALGFGNINFLPIGYHEYLLYLFLQDGSGFDLDVNPFEPFAQIVKRGAFLCNSELIDDVLIVRFFSISKALDTTAE
jgi:hypothetical protein